MGGTFDPIHLGHLDVARAARRALELDRVSLLPSNVPPHRATPHASSADRMAMTTLAVENEPGLAASDLEIRQDGPSYTSATLERLAAHGLDATAIFFVTGADAFRDIPTWKDFPALLDHCHFVVISRPGCPAPGLRQILPSLADRMVVVRDAGFDTGRPSIFLVDADTAPVSSTDVRRRVASGASIEGLVPPAVTAYIDAHGLYR
jgi:nicotinate-nucleotide adenylyltransferase